MRTKTANGRDDGRSSSRDRTEPSPSAMSAKRRHQPAGDHSKARTTIGPHQQSGSTSHGFCRNGGSPARSGRALPSAGLSSSCRGAGPSSLTRAPFRGGYTGEPKNCFGNATHLILNDPASPTSRATLSHARCDHPHRAAPLSPLGEEHSESLAYISRGDLTSRSTERPLSLQAGAPLRAQEPPRAPQRFLG
jgi:hypothetical protein